MNVLRVADYVALRCEKNRIPVSNAKLNYLLYFLRDNYERMFQEELYPTGNFFGIRPTFHEVYVAFQSYGAMPIVREMDPKEKEEVKSYISENLDTEKKNYVDTLIDRYAKQTMSQLYGEYESTKPLEWKFGGKNYGKSPVFF